MFPNLYFVNLFTPEVCVCLLSRVQLRPEIDIGRMGASSLPQWPRGHRINHMEAAVGGELDGTCCQVVVIV